jgi:hypothetical protein
MLTVPGTAQSYCDGVTRRNFLLIGGLAVGGLTLADVLRCQAEQPANRRHKSVIMVFLPGGPSHIDLVDLKPNAPAEIRGPFRRVATRVPGIDFCEHLPRLAQMADRLAVLRSVVGGPDDHACQMCLTGWSRQGTQPAGNWPTFGAVVSRMLGAADTAVPPYVNLAAPMIHPPYNDPGAGFLGQAHEAFRPSDEGGGALSLQGVSLDRLQHRRKLLSAFDGLNRRADQGGTLAGVDAFYDQAFRLVISSKVRDALDISREDPRVVARYGRGTPALIEGFNAAPRLTEQFLVARRLVEAGARVVTLAFGAYDWHEKNFSGLEGQLPYLDQGLSALVTDLHERGLADDVAVCVWGEFGRSPRINRTAGRDHWPAVSCALLAGGGLRTGQVIGATNRWGEYPVERPIHFLEVLATLYDHLGIDLHRATLRDLSGRPQYLLAEYQPIRELKSARSA